MSVFAAAYQNMLASQGKGGGLTGQAAVAALLDAVPTGQVRSSELLPFVSEEMQVRAAPKLDIARETSQGWQGRLANQRTGWAMIASESGVEEGQRNFFRFFTQWMNENQQIPQRFGEMWKGFSKQFAIAGGFGSLLRETLGGRDTIIKEWLGEERTQEFAENLATLSANARSAAHFLGLMGGDTKSIPIFGSSEASIWEEIAVVAEGATQLAAGVTEGDAGKAWDGVKRLVGPIKLREGSVLGNAYSVVNPERDDEGNALPWLNYTGRQPVYYPRGAELLMQGGQNGVNGSSPTLVIENLTVTANSSDPDDLADRFLDRVEDSYRRAIMGISR